MVVVIPVFPLPLQASTQSTQVELRRDLTEPFFVRSSSFGASEEGRVPGLQCDGAGVE